MDPFRITPQLPAQHMKTYVIAAPKATHYRPATCAEAECTAHLHGWRSTADESTELGRQQADYIRSSSGRRFTEHRDDTGLTVFTFEAGQVCFRGDEHTVRIDRPEIFLVRDGDHRGNPRGTSPRIHTTPQAWVDDFGEHQERIAETKERG